MFVKKRKQMSEIAVNFAVSVTLTKDKFLNKTLRGDMPEMTGKAWMFVALIVGVVLVFGPQALTLVKGALGLSVNTTSSAFSLPT